MALAFGTLLYLAVRGRACWAVVAYHATLLLANIGIGGYCMVGTRVPLLDSRDFPFPAPAPFFDLPTCLFLANNYVSRRSVNRLVLQSVSNALVAGFGLVAFFVGILPEAWAGTMAWQENMNPCPQPQP